MVGPPPATWAVDPGRARAFEIAPGLWQLRLPLPWEGIGHVNAYAVQRTDGLLLVDCGSAGDPSHRAGLRAALGRAGFSLADVSVLAGTHAHSDHIGLAAWVIERSGCAFWMHPDTAHFYDAMRDPVRVGAARRRRAAREGVAEGDLEPYADVREETEGVLAPVEPDRPLVAGTVLESTLGDWEVLPTPGHCPSHVALVQRGDGTAIVGDVVSRSFAPWFDYGYSPDPVGEYLASLDALSGLDPRTLALPGHGRPVDDLPAALTTYESGMARRLAATRAAVAAGATTGREIAHRVLGETGSGEAAVWRLAEVIAYLRHLRLTGAVVRSIAPDGAHRYRTAAER